MVLKMSLNKNEILYLGQIITMSRDKKLKFKESHCTLASIWWSKFDFFKPA